MVRIMGGPFHRHYTEFRPCLDGKRPDVEPPSKVGPKADRLPLEGAIPVLEHLGLLGIDHGLPQFIAIAVHEAVEAVPGEADAVVGDAVLREIVGADAVGTVATADLLLAQSGAFAV